MDVQKRHVSENKQAMDKLKDTYLHWTKAQLEKLHSLVYSLERDDSHHPEKFLAEISTLGGDIRGLGGSFGYFLMTDIAFSLCKYINNTEETSRLHFSIIAAHVKAMDTVIYEEIEGTGGDVGAGIVTDLYEITVKENS